MIWSLLQKAVSAPARRKPGRREGDRLFCSQPFNRFEVLGGGGERGDVFFCCQSWLPKSIGNMKDQPVEQVWNSRAARDIRRSVLDGSFRYCKADVCPYLQRVDGPVQRVKDIEDDRLLAVVLDEDVIGESEKVGLRLHDRGLSRHKI